MSVDAMSAYTPRPSESPIFFMKILMSVALGLPSASDEMVISMEPKVCRAARDTRSTYSVDIFDASARIVFSREMALCSVPGKPDVRSSIWGSG